MAKLGDDSIERLFEIGKSFTKYNVKASFLICETNLKSDCTLCNEGVAVFGMTPDGRTNLHLVVVERIKSRMRIKDVGFAGCRETTQGNALDQFFLGYHSHSIVN